MNNLSGPPPALGPEFARAMGQGWTEEQVRWCEASLQEVVLPSVWDEDRDPDTQIAEMRQMVHDLAGDEPDARWADYVAAHYLALLRPIQMAAILLATQAYRRGDDERGWLSIEAEGLLATVESIADEIRAATPETLEVLEPELDAVRIDCDFARGSDLGSRYLAAALGVPDESLA